MSSAAELALKKKFALLQKKKDAVGGGKGGTGSSAAQAAPASQDPARLLAIRALQAKRADAEAKLASTVVAADAAPKRKATKVKLVIPKREAAQAAPQAAQPGKAAAGAEPGSGVASAPSDPARAAALAALRAKAAQQQPGAAAMGGGSAPAAATGPALEKQQQQQQAPKRPTLKFPSVRPRPMQQQLLQHAGGNATPSAAAALDGPFGADHAYQQQQQREDSCYGTGDAGDNEHHAKRQRMEQHGGDAAGGGGSGNDQSGPTLFVGDLPQFWSNAELHDFFNSEFGAVLETRVIGSQCYGFVTFASVADAEGVLEFAQQQGIWAEDRMLRINWAQGSIAEWKKGPAVHHDLDPGEGAPMLEAYEHPRVKEARLQAQQLAAAVDVQQIQALAMQRPPERQLVSYEDL